MRVSRVLLLALFVLAPAGIARAQCSYFRVAYKLVSCGLDHSNPEKLPGMVPASIDEPGWLDQAPGETAKIICSCDYSLKGSAPLCDFDRTDEETYRISTPNIHDTCQRAKSLCSDYCALNLSS